MPTIREITFQEQLREIRAELAVRRTAFRAWVRQGKMRKEVADHKFAAMGAVLAVLTEIENEVKAGGDTLSAVALAQVRQKEGLPDE